MQGENTLKSNQFSDDAEEEHHPESSDIEPTQKTYIHKSLTKEIKIYLSLLRRKQRNLLSTNTKIAQ